MAERGVPAQLLEPQGHKVRLVTSPHLRLYLTCIACMLYSTVEMEGRADSRRRGRTAEALERIRERLAHAEEGWFFTQIAERVVTQRRARGLSQVELAELCGTTQSASTL